MQDAKSKSLQSIMQLIEDCDQNQLEEVSTFLAKRGIKRKIEEDEKSNKRQKVENSE